MTRPTHLRLVQTSQRQGHIGYSREVPRLRVRIAVASDRVPFGRSREFQITEHDLPELLDTALRLERTSR